MNLPPYGGWPEFKEGAKRQAMHWKDIMNPKNKDVSSSVSLPCEGEITELDLSKIPREDVFIRVVDGSGTCVGSVKRELLEYLHASSNIACFLSILDKIGEAVIAIDKNGRIFYANPSYTKVLGVAIGRVLGRYLQQVEPGSALLTVLKPPHTSVIQKKQLIRSINKYVSIHVYPIFLQGEFYGAVSIFTDITRINELNQEVARISQVAEEYNRQLEAETILRQNQVIGESRAYTNSIVKVITAAKTDAVVLLRGENGVGKEIFTRILRENSPRKNKPFITVNCSAIPDTLIESELFGYEEGSFTGAKRGGRLGKFQLAQGGTLFLDEIGDMPMPMQAKLLRVLQEGEIEKIGRQKNIPVDVRIVAATNQPLEEMIERNQFRKDLYYRLNVVSIHIPPLRERGNDILLLADYYLSVYNRKYGKNLRISSEVYQRFLHHRWPGNVRELQNTMESMVVLCQGERLLLTDLPDQFLQPEEKPTPEQHVRVPTSGEFQPGPLSEQLAAYERGLIASTLSYFSGDRGKAMEVLGLSRRTFYRKLSQYQIH